MSEISSAGARKQETQMTERIEPVIGTPSEVQPDPGKPPRASAKKKWITTLTLTNNTCSWPFDDPASPDFRDGGQVPRHNTAGFIATRTMP
jgi:hypothetical protein